MTGERFDDLAGADGPRPLPDDLAARLEGELTDPVARLLHAVDGPRPLPSDLRDRLEASVAAASGGGGELPDAVRQRVDRAQRMRSAGWWALRAVPSLAAAVAVLVLATSLVGGGGGSRPDAAGGATGPDATRPLEPDQLQLVAFESCTDLVDHLKEEAAAFVGPFGLEAHHPYGDLSGATRSPSGRLLSDGPATTMAPVGPVRAPSPAAGGATSGRQAPDAAGGPAARFSVTNVQERGVDEPDTVETDGDHLWTLTGNRLDVVRAAAGETRHVATLLLGGAAGSAHHTGMVLAGDRLLVLGESYEEPGEGAASGRALFRSQGRAVVTVVDVADPAQPAVAATVRLDGTARAARLVDGTLQVVVVHHPTGPAWTQPVAPTETAAQQATAENLTILARSDADDWLPGYTVERPGGERAEGVLTRCTAVRRPAEFAGLGTTTVVAIDPGDPQPQASEAVFADPGTVYASTENLYVATTTWAHPQATPVPAPQTTIPAGGPAATRAGDAVAPGMPVPAPPPPPDQGGVSTSIHRFALAGGTATYRGSGPVLGQVRDQWSLSEHDGHLRVVATTGQWGDQLESGLTVLRIDDGELVPVGSVGGLGKGERVQSVRFMGEVGYVVTFRQIDPLYVLDLADPTAPTVAGELKITGYSAYLHPIGDGLLLGVGVDADATGMRRGMQVAVFDVSDPAHPTPLHTLTHPDRRALTEHDHHAFLWWDGRAIVPTAEFGFPFGGDMVVPGRPVAEAMVFAASEASLHLDGAVRHVDRPGTPTAEPGLITRAVVVGDTLYTVSGAGVLASAVDSLADQAWVPFPATP